MKTLAALTAALVAGLLAFQAGAATDSNVTVTANVPTILALTTSGSSVTFNLTDANYNSGADSNIAIVESVAAHTLAIRSNRPWTVSVKSGAAVFSGPSGTSKSAGDLEVKADGSNYAAVSTSDVTLATGTAGGFIANTFNVDYRLTSSLDSDAPGAYTLPVVYTVANE